MWDDIPFLSTQRRVNAHATMKRYTKNKIYLQWSPSSLDTLYCVIKKGTCIYICINMCMHSHIMLYNINSLLCNMSFIIFYYLVLTIAYVLSYNATPSYSHYLPLPHTHTHTRARARAHTYIYVCIILFLSKKNFFLKILNSLANINSKWVFSNCLMHL